MKTYPTVSIIIPTYNHAHFLPLALGSALNQTYRDHEIIVVDDGSTDRTEEAVLKFKDSRIRYIHQANKGLAGARNTGLREALGKYVVFLDADDLFLPCKLEVQLQWLESHPECGFVAGGWNYIDEEGRVLGGYQPGENPPELSTANWLRGCRVNPVSVIVKKGWVDQLGGFDESFRQVEDWDMWLRLAYAGCEMGWVNEVVASYRFSSGQMTLNAAVQKKSAEKLLDKFFSQDHIPVELMAIRDEAYLNLYLISAGREFGVGQWLDGQMSLRKAVEHEPELLRIWEERHLSLLFSWEDFPYCRTTPVTFRGVVFDHLPEELHAFRLRRKQIMGEASLKTYYKAYNSRDWALVRRTGLLILKYFPLHALHRRFWSIWAKSFMPLEVHGY